MGAHDDQVGRHVRRHLEDGAVAATGSHRRDDVTPVVWFGLRANRAGTHWGWIPIALAALVSLFFVGITIVNLGAQLLGIEGP